MATDRSVRPLDGEPGSDDAKTGKMRRVFSAMPLLEIATVVIVTAVVVVPVAPGIYTIDSQAMLRAALEDRISNWYSPFHGWVFGAASEVGLPPDTALVTAIALLTVALIGFYRLGLSRKWACVGAAATVLWPPVYGMVGWVGRDVWFVVELVGVMACLGWAWKSDRWSLVLHGGALVLALGAVDARQNGIYLSGAVAASAIARHWHPMRRTIKVGALVLAVVVAMGSSYFLVNQAQRAVVSAWQFPDKPLMLYDLAGMSVVLGEVILPPTIHPDGRLDQLETWWDPSRLNAPDRDAKNTGAFDLDDHFEQLERIESGTDVTGAGAADTQGANDIEGLHLYYFVDIGTMELRSAHRSAIREHPWAYVQVRMQHYLAQVGLTRQVEATYYSWTDEIGWDQGEALRQRWPAANDLRNELLEWTTGERGSGRIWHAPWLYLVLGLIGSALLVTSRSHVALGWLLILVTVLSQSLLWIGTPATNYRYQLPAVVMGIAAFVIGAVEQRRAGPLRLARAPNERFGQASHRPERASVEREGDDLDLDQIRVEEPVDGP